MFMLMFIYVIFSPLVWDSQMWRCFVCTLAEIQRQNEQRCEQEIEDLMREIRARNITPNTSDTTWPIVVNQIEHNETAKEETQPAEMEEVQPLNETPAREQLKTGPARARKKPRWLKRLCHLRNVRECLRYHNNEYCSVFNYCFVVINFILFS